MSLFVERAAAVAQGFELTAENAEDIARICFRLDGLPLALELAAGRVGALTPAAIAARLDDRFRLLRAGSSQAPTRQQTLEATLRWSHDLLEPDERVLFRRLGVFAGGFELGAAEAVCAGDLLEAAEVADVLGRLVEKSLVSFDDRGPDRRYRLLETVRLYASGELEDSGETQALAARHADWALALAEATPDTQLLDREAANMRAALDTLLARDSGGALRLCAALTPFWLRRIDLVEAQRRFAAALAGSPEPTALRAEALLAASAIDFAQRPDGFAERPGRREPRDRGLGRRSPDRMAWAPAPRGHSRRLGRRRGRVDVGGPGARARRRARAARRPRRSASTRKVPLNSFSASPAWPRRASHGAAICSGSSPPTSGCPRRSTSPSSAGPASGGRSARGSSSRRPSSRSRS